MILLFKHSKEGLGYSLKKIATPYLNIKKTEFCAVGDQGYFISSNILYRFYNDKVEKVDCYFNNNKLVSKNNLSVVGGVLLIPLKDDVSNQIYCYDTITGKECFVKRYSIMARTAGFAVDGKVIRKLEFSYADNSGEQWISKPLNFGSIKNKTITEIQAEVIGRGDLRLSGDYTDKVLTLTNGFNIKKFNFNSTKFTIYTENISSDFFVKSIKIKYLE